MAEILTQEEVDALLAALQEGEDLDLETLPDRFSPEKTAIPYNFKRPDRISKDQIRFLQFMHDRFARNFSSVLSTYLRSIVEVELVSIEQITYSEFLMALPDPTFFCVLGVYPLEAKFALEINPSLVFPIIDRLLGGPGEPVEEVRPLTDLEMDLMDGVVNRALEELEKVWEDVIEDIEFVVEVKESSPHLIQIVAPNEVVVLISFEVRIGEVKGMINLCIPAIALEPISSMLGLEMFTGTREVSEEDSKKVREHVRRAVVTLEGLIGATTLLLEEIMDLDVGDIIRLDTFIDSLLPVLVEGIEKFYGRVGEKKGRKVLRIEKIKRE
ncbi:flagellar motor switch protein FliM [Thermosulfidibacter takaii ABI70S6]|uniref:Flagellar motor switch protein FliM n=1 Tax=Thermosulfidibacter takaii (strain DSM 17441 / JCM 13301 / NBRC 103674 / ABI70S6) TaxID=1298851 RepID=A0A0S3QSZ2_THET7|nr:flagellar motor switch protein FliM [Thermosulfidibacter takaii]BAT71459.1 flagellar motor switch protein FliM [Thermosulfidibacter takaii ABI70S6]